MHESMLGKMHFKHPSIFLLRYLMYTDKQFKHFRRICSFAAIDERRHPTLVYRINVGYGISVGGGLLPKNQ